MALLLFRRSLLEAPSNRFVNSLTGLGLLTWVLTAALISIGLERMCAPASTKIWTLLKQLLMQIMIVSCQLASSTTLTMQHPKQSELLTPQRSSTPQWSRWTHTICTPLRQLPSLQDYQATWLWHQQAPSSSKSTVITQFAHSTMMLSTHLLAAKTEQRAPLQSSKLQLIPKPVLLWLKHFAQCEI